ncbi:MAG: VRR-NUC domain-containing protein [Lachnospiraceae bacterium]|nr:VRR-NUC domain-containing protein [Lachnospiraceae bacterium]
MNMRTALKSEDTEQINVIQWAQWNTQKYPELKWLYHCPNGGSRNRLEAVKLKQMGVKAGVSDLHLPYPKGIYHGLYIEMKYGNNKQQDTQKEFLSDMAAAGHYVVTCYSAEEAIKILQEYCELRDSADKTYMQSSRISGRQYKTQMSIANNSILKDGKITKPKLASEKTSVPVE